MSNLRLKFQELVEAVAHDDERRYVLAELHYLFAMKCAAMRLGEELHDLDDVRYLLRHLDITSSKEAFEIIGQYFDDDQLHPKTRLALEELLSA